MRVLWVTNIVLPELCDVFGFKRTVFGGWISGMWNEIKKIDGITLGICVPIINDNFMKDGSCFGYQYYSFKFTPEYNCIKEQKERFEHIISVFQPDLIHIWGTEYSHSYAMLEACEELGIANYTLINLQGLVSFCSKHYAYGLNEAQISYRKDNKCIADEVRQFEKKGAYESALLRKAVNVSGRTNWDYTCTRLINPKVSYHYCKEILRDIFYKNHGKWAYDKCKKNTIFITQAGYALKGLHNVLEGLSYVKNIVPDVRVYIGGANQYEVNTPYSDIICSLIEKYGLKDTIIFVGFLDENKMLEYYLNSNLLLVASNIENSSNSICEALHVGIPIISTYVGGIPTLLRHNENALLYPVDESYLVARYILDLFSDPDLCKTLSLNGKKSVENENVTQISNSLYNIYKKIANS